MSSKLIAIESCVITPDVSKGTMAGSGQLTSGQTTSVFSNGKILLDQAEFSVSGCMDSNGNTAGVGSIKFTSTSQTVSIEGKKPLRMDDEGTGTVNGVNGSGSPISFPVYFKITQPGQTTTYSA